MKTATATVTDWVAKCKRRMEAVHKEASLRTFEIAQTPKAKGGNMPVDTGFLRASGMASLSGLPETTGRPEDGVSYTYDDGDVALTINGSKIGDTLYFGWIANYAHIQEYEYGNAFMRSAIDRWQQTVNEVVRELRVRST